MKKRRHINGIDVSILEPYNGYKEKFIYGNKHIDRACKSAVIKVYTKLDIENPIIRINTAFKGCSSLEKISVLPRIYHN